MWQDVSDLQRFYDSPPGQVAARLIRRRLRAFWPDLSGRRVLALGYGPPFLGFAAAEAERVAAAMPDRQGAVRWPLGDAARTLLCHEAALPLPDNAFDRILLVHAVESSEQIRPMLREVWRTAADGGRVIAVVPNRRGVWARLEHTPFGHGRPFSEPQLAQLLRDSLFRPLRSGFALYAPPARRRFVRRLAVPWERLGARWMGPFGGVVLCEAEKQVHGAVPLSREARRVRPAAAPAPHAASACGATAAPPATA